LLVTLWYCRAMDSLPPCLLPSATSACGVVHREDGAVARAALHTAGRAALIGVGLFAMGERDARKLAKYSIGAALAIEVFALSWAYAHRTPTAALTAP
jgi:hypothetical protein